MDEKSLSPKPENSLAYYKSQYEQLEHELAEFQASSQQLEAELEKDVEAAEKREHILQEKVESLSFEVEEWKTKYKQSKLEASAAQSALQKEITILRDTNRNLQLKLRDIEVENDDIERQARNTTSSLENLESKYNMAVERAVLMEDDIKTGEQERENLRIETQRLRDELSDLKIEVEILQDKLRKRQFPPASSDSAPPNDPSSPESIVSSHRATTPRDSMSATATISGNETPPSPPISETSGPVQPVAMTPINLPKSRLKMPSGDSSITPKPTGRYTSTGMRSSRGPSAPNSIYRVRSVTPVIRQSNVKAPAKKDLPNSNSLTHIRSLTAQMQRLEKRVQYARSKLPTPISTPPRSSPRNESLLTNMPPYVTIRNKRRTGGSAVSMSSLASEDTSISSTRNSTRLSTSRIGRLSTGTVSRQGHRSSSIRK